MTLLEEIRNGKNAALEFKETYRVERTKSTTDKFGEAVCAFANDMPDCDKPGYIF